MTRYRFQILLLSLFALMLAMPFLPTQGFVGRSWASFFYSMLLLAAVAAVSHRRLAGVIALCLCAATFLLQIVGLWYHSDTFQVVSHVADILFLGYVTSVILQHLFTTTHVTFSTISAALCVYLLLAVLWAIVYSLVEVTDPGAFAYNATGDGQVPSMRFGGGQSVTPVYYSLVTITTLGYGDIVPVSPVASMLAVVEAVIGQFYLTVLVAWLVGQYIASSIKDSANG
jgi:voltage-gated potassium channel